MTKYCVLTVTVNNNTNENHDRIIFTVKDTKLYFPVVTLSANDNRELLKLGNKWLSKDLQDQYVGMNVKAKVRIKIQQTSIEIFSNQTL